MIANGCISFESHEQVTIARSSMESEYMILTDAAKDIIFLRRLLTSLKLDVIDALLIKTDLDSTLKHVKTNINHPRTKHINHRHQYIDEVYNNGGVDIEHVPTIEQFVDILTKPLNANAHAHAVG
jgi:hypothetical protein